MRKVLCSVGILIAIIGCSKQETVSFENLLDKEQPISHIVIQLNQGTSTKQQLTNPDEIAEF